MRQIYALIFFFLDVAFDQGAGAALAECVNDCLKNTSDGCDSRDVESLCSASKREQFIDELSSCIRKGCKLDEVVPAEDLHSPLYVRADRAKVESEGPSSTTPGANEPVGGVGQGESATEPSTMALEGTETVVTMEVVDSTEKAMSTAKGTIEGLVSVEDVSSVEVMSTEDTATSTTSDPVKAESTPTTTAVSEATASTSTEGPEESSTSTEDEEPTDTYVGPPVYYYPSSGLSAGAKAGIGVGVAFGVIGLGCLVAAIWIIKRKRAISSAPEVGASHKLSVKSLNPFSRQVEVAEIDGRPAPQELPA